MPIFSGNRVSGGMNIVANENYGEHDFGRVLYESAINDGIVFNSAVLREFKEIDAIREGTMINSELQSFQEFSAREAWDGLKQKLKKLWEKIKGIFKKVTAKLAVWFVRNGKAYVAMNKHLLHADVAKCKIPEFRTGSDADYQKLLTNPLSDQTSKLTANSAIGTYNTVGGEVSEINAANKAKDLINTAYGLKLESTSELGKAFIDKAFPNKHTNVEFGGISGVTVSKLFDVISTGKKPIKDLKKAEKEADKSIKKVIKEIDKMSKEREKDESNDKYAHASKYCSAYQTAMTLVTKAQIAMVKFNIKQCRACVSKLAAYSPTNESALFEMSCWMEGAEDFEDEIEAADEHEAEAEDVKIEIDVHSDGDVDVEVED